MTVLEAAANPDEPLVSVVIPTRNCISYLPAALASVLAQGVSRLEIIVVDDASTDGTDVWLDARRRHLPQLIVLRGTGDGPDVARNRAIAIARAPLIAFLDADDIWQPGKLSPQLAFHAADAAAVFSFTDYLHVDVAGRSFGTCFEFWPAFRRIVGASASPGGYQRLPQPFAAILAENVVGTSAVVARRDALQRVGGFDASVRSTADWDLWLRLSAIGPVGFTRDVATQYLMARPGSLSRDARLRIACMRDTIARHAASAPQHPPASAIRRARGTVRMLEADLARAEGRSIAAIVADVGALCLAPSTRLARVLMSDVLRAATPRALAKPTRDPIAN
jgi:glycosyltransferase involved in cell wall biosynthesis